MHKILTYQLFETKHHFFVRKTIAIYGTIIREPLFSLKAPQLLLNVSH